MPNVMPEPFATNLREALAARQKTYEGRPCKKGHTTRYVAKGCVQCARDTYDRKRRLVAAKGKLAHALEPRTRMLTAARHRAKVKGLLFNLDLDDLEIPDVCPVLGIEMDSPSVDRINNDLGYTRGNVRVISLRANTLKGDSTIEELEAILAYMRAA